jgi:thermostable 8-oxoguanine DNA glycosylase
MKKIFDKDILANLKEYLINAKAAYKYQEKLTPKLDKYNGDFTEMTLWEIVLWKVNRYPEITDEIITEINDLRKAYTEEKAATVLKNLLDLKGFDLPMASTILRFACPKELQIIDQRVYRFIYPDKDKLKLPFNKENKVTLYFAYINQLKEICIDYNIDFSQSDRLLYQLDKIHNKDKPIHKSEEIKE